MPTPATLPDLTVPGAALSLTPEYSLVYTQIVQPKRVFTVSHYFQRWVAMFGLYAEYQSRQTSPAKPGWVGPLVSAGKRVGATAWAVVQCQQVLVWNQRRAGHRQTSVKCELAFLSRESGLPVDRLIEIFKEPLCQWFVHSQTGRLRYDAERGHPANEPNTYAVRLDDPLVPADAYRTHLWLGQVRVSGATPSERATQRIRAALELDWAAPETRAQFLAEDLRAPVPVTFFGPQPREIIDLVCELDSLPPTDPGYAQVRNLCETLQRRITRPEDTLGGTYYFRKNLVPQLGCGLAWAVILLRDRCFSNGTEWRDTWHMEGYRWLAEALAVDEKTVQRWLPPPDSHWLAEVLGTPPDQLPSVEWLARHFQVPPTRIQAWLQRPPAAALTLLRLLDSKKIRGGAYRHRIWVCLHDPLLPTDRDLYLQLLAQLPPPGTEPLSRTGLLDTNPIQANPPAGHKPNPAGKKSPSAQAALPLLDTNPIQPTSSAGHKSAPVAPSWTQTQSTPKAGGHKSVSVGHKPNDHITSQIPSIPFQISSANPLLQSSSSSPKLAPKLAPETVSAKDEDEEKRKAEWSWEDLFKGTRRANKENRQTLKQLVDKIPVTAYVACYLANLANLKSGNPVGLTLANLLTQIETGESEFEAGLPFDELAHQGPAFVTTLLHRLGNLETEAGAISFSVNDSAVDFEGKEAANRYLDTFGELAAQVRNPGKYQAQAVQKLRARITHGLNELCLPSLPLRAGPTEAVQGQGDEEASAGIPLAPRTETLAASGPLDELRQPTQCSITAEEAWAVVYEKLRQAENLGGESAAALGKWRKFGSAPSSSLAEARLVAFDAPRKQFSVAVADQQALTQWQARETEVRLALLKLLHGPCRVEFKVTKRAPDQTLQAVAGEWETSSPTQLWQATLEQLQLELSKEIFGTWVRDTKLVASRPDGFVIGAPHAYAKDFLASRLAQPISRTLSGVVGRPMSVSFVV